MLATEMVMEMATEAMGHDLGGQGAGMSEMLKKMNNTGVGTLWIVIQVVAVILTLIGLGVLVCREQTQNSTYLLLANIASLMVNATYLFILQADSESEALLSYKLQYLGTAVFYMFFTMFITNYLGKKLPKGGYVIWSCFEVFGILSVWSNWASKYIISQTNFGEVGEMGIHYLTTQEGPIITIRYGVIFFVMIGCCLYALATAFYTKDRLEKKKNSVICLASGMVMISILIQKFASLPIDVLPLFTSISVFIIIVNVLKGNFFTITDMGRTWVFEHMKDAFVIVDSSYGYLDSNEKANELFPEIKMTFKGRRFSEPVQNIFTSEEIIVAYQDHWYSKLVTPLEQKGIVEGYSIVLTDITRERDLMQQTLEAKEKAEEANEAKSNFMSNMSHEIRTPMNAIVGMTDILLRSDLKDQDREYLVNIKNSGNALLNIINDILDFSKIESGKLEIIEDEYEPMSMISDLSMIFLTRIQEKPVELLIDLDPNMPNKLYGDSLRLRQVIINIVNNAIKFTEEGFVKLTMKIESAENDEIILHFDVQDTGQGIKEEDLGKLFKSFGQVDTKKNRSKEGTGLGLAISKQLVELMGGQITLDSVYGQGSTFHFSVRNKVVSEKLATEIHPENKSVVVTSVFSNDILEENLKNLCSLYEIKHIDFKKVQDMEKEPDFLFMDYNVYREEGTQILKQAMDPTKIVVLINPLRETVDGTKALASNKPLYTLNFCNLLNHEKNRFESKNEHALNFKAEEAKILIVDDNEMNLKVVTGLLEPLQMQIDTATSGKEAIELTKRNHDYHIIFMDHMMPIMDGVETTHRIREIDGEYFKNVPIVALTANALSGAKEMFISEGMNDFVAKPIELKAICKVLKNWLPKEVIKELSEEEMAKQDGTCLPDHLPEIEGLDVIEGIKNSGSEKLFYDLLGDFYKVIDMKSNKIEKCVADQMIRDYTVEVHALKNTARMIGALELSDWFYRMELAGTASDIEKIKTETPELMELYRSYKPILKPYGQVQNSDKKDASTETIVETLEKLKSSIDEFDLDGADAAMKELESYKLPESFDDSMEQLRAYVADVAMEEIMNMVDELIWKIKS